MTHTNQLIQIIIQTSIEILMSGKLGIKQKGYYTTTTTSK